jgi:16S rRNA processing protein RimM
VAQAAQRRATGTKRGSGGRSDAPEPRYLVVGQIVGAHGLYGELKVQLSTDDPHRFGELEHVFLGKGDEEPSARLLGGYRLHKGRALLRLEGCTDRPSAQAMRGLLVQVKRDDAIPLEQGEYFEHQILDLAVWTADDECLGTIKEIIFTGANEVYVVQEPAPSKRETLIPAIKDVVLEVDLDTGRLIVELPEGLR